MYFCKLDSLSLDFLCFLLFSKLSFIMSFEWLTKFLGFGPDEATPEKFLGFGPDKATPELVAARKRSAEHAEKRAKDHRQRQEALQAAFAPLIAAAKAAECAADDDKKEEEDEE